MRLKKFLLSLSMIGLLVSCAEESVIDLPKETNIPGLDATFDLQINMGEIMTKADWGAETPYTYATEEELTVKNLTVAVWQVENKGESNETLTLAGTKYATGLTASTTTAGNHGPSIGGETVRAYKVPGIPAKTGDIRILVVANAGDLSSYKTYDSFVAQTVTNGSSTFDPTALIKVGEIDYELTKTASQSIQIPMTQLAAKIAVTITPAEVASEGDFKWEYEPAAASAFTATNVNMKSDLLINSTTVKGGKTSNGQFATTSFTSPADTENGFVFYTYENLSLADNAMEITAKGRFKQSLKNTEGDDAIYADDYAYYSDEEIPFTVNGAFFREGSSFSGFKHGNLYDINVMVDPTTMKIKYDLQVKPWGKARDINMEPHYLYVRDLQLIMPAITTHSTIYKSSPAVVTLKENGIADGVTIKVERLQPTADGKITAEELTDVSQRGNPQVEIVPDEDGLGTGSIMITFDNVPKNYVGRRITFVVENEAGLTQTVMVDQYPPLYVTSYTTKGGTGGAGNEGGGGTPIDVNGQDNKNMYIFNTLVSDFRAGLPTYEELEFDDFYTVSGTASTKEDGSGSKRNWRDNSTYFGTYNVATLRNYDSDNSKNFNQYKRGHTTIEQYKQIANNRLEFLNNKAISGYPQTDANGKTLSNWENNLRISPSFMLASQMAVTSTMDWTYDQAQSRCDKYFEINEKGVKYTDWRMPTLAEVYFIDVLQNTKESGVKFILEGAQFWSAYCEWGLWLTTTNNTATKYDNVFDLKEGYGEAVKLMDNRVRDFKKTEMRAPIRCVRDMKDGD